MNLPSITFIINGTTRKGRRMSASLEQVFHPYPVRLVFTEHGGHATQLAAAAVVAGGRIIVSVGGDGTLNEVVNGLVQGCAAVQIPPDTVRLGILPTGSGNDFVRNFGAQPTPLHLRRLIDDDQTTTIDIGVAAFQSVGQQPTQRYFINISDIGIGGVIAEKLSRYSQGWLGAGFTYQRAIISTLLGYSPQWLTVSTSSESLTAPMMSLVVANGRYFGSGLGIAPAAVLNDGMLEVVMLKNITIGAYLRQLPQVRRCQRLQHPEVAYSQAAHITVSAVGAAALPIDMDGEFVGTTPVTFAVLTRYIRIIA
jgi:YegS/Rv2252/BmrU family lipid kinase